MRPRADSKRSESSLGTSVWVVESLNLLQTLRVSEWAQSNMWLTFGPKLLESSRTNRKPKRYCGRSRIGSSLQDGLYLYVISNDSVNALVYGHLLIDSDSRKHSHNKTCYSGAVSVLYCRWGSTIYCTTQRKELQLVRQVVECHYGQKVDGVL